DLSSCQGDSEIFQLARALPKGTIDAIVGGHTPAGIAPRVAHIPIVESYDKGAAFGRIDIDVSLSKTAPKILRSQTFAPRQIATLGAGLDRYEDADVLIDPTVDAAIQPALAAARKQREQKLGVTVVRPIVPAYATE